MPNETSAVVIRKFQGLYDTGLNEPDPQGLAERFDDIKARKDWRPRVTTRSLVIRTADEFLRFIDGIPKTVMDFVPSPAPSDDPLLEHPAIDFDSHMVLAIISHEPNRFVDPEIAVERTPDALRVLCRFTEPSPVVQKAIGYGAYCAVVVGRFDGEVVFALE